METILLRKEPLPVIELFDDSFKIINEDNESEVFVFSAVDSLEISKRINWFVTALSIVFEFFLNGSGNVYKEKDILQFNYQKVPQKFSFKGGDPKLAQQTINKINQVILKSQ